MTILAREQVVARLKQLPSLPTAVSGLLASFSNEDVDVDQIASQIGRDQGLTARVLRVANSSFYGLQTRVGTIHDAVVILGFRAVRSMVLAVGMNGVFRVDQCPDFDAAAYLRHSVGTGLAARALAPLSGQNPELAFTAGLLHDIGKLVLASAFPKEYEAVLIHRRDHDGFPLEAERSVIGIDHAEVGGLLAEAWRFPEELHDAVAWHHEPVETSDASLANLVHVAEATAHALGLAHSPAEMVMPVDSLAWRRVRATPADLALILPKIETEFDETCQALSV